MEPGGTEDHEEFLPGVVEHDVEHDAPAKKLYDYKID